MLLALLGSSAPASASDGLADTLAATARFHRTEIAQSEGWDLVEGLDSCFDSQPDGGMGYHYINLDELLDPAEDPLRPEALVYAPGPRGQRRLVAVEWIVPGDGSEDPPTVLGHEFHYNDGLSVWVLHAWIFSHNPAGMFEDWNPRVSCPD